MVFISIAAAGVWHTLTSSAKPIAIFNQTKTQAMLSAEDLLKLSVYLAPLMLALLLICAFFIWPLMGVPLFIGSE